MTRAYVGLGSNLGDRERSIRRAAELVGALRLSMIRETEPWGIEDQPLFLNAVAEVETDLPPRRLLDHLLEVERTLGRTRDGARFGPRTIDLDLLLYGTNAGSFSSLWRSWSLASSYRASDPCRLCSRR